MQPGGITGLRFSADGRFLAYAAAGAVWVTDTNHASDIYPNHFQPRTNLLVSKSFVSGFAANGASDSPDITSDGSRIAIEAFL